MVNLKYLDDESVHSWVFRNLNVLGSLNFTSVVGSNGKWVAEPRFTSSCYVDIESLDDVDLLAFFRRSGIAVKSASMFDYPVDYLQSVERVFQGIDYVSYAKGSIPIRFCPFCIRSSIEEFGFAYFKSSWLYDVSCEGHGQQLIQIKPSTYRDVLNALNIVMSGGLLSNNATEEPTPLKQNKNNEECVNHVMPCLLNDFYWWASRRRYDDYLDTSHNVFYNSYSIRKRMSDEQLHGYFKTYSKRYPRQFADFLSEKAELKECWFGLSQPCSMKENIIKSIRHNCSKCLDFSDYCISGEVIYRFSLGEIDHLLTIRENKCDLFLRYGRRS